MKAFRLCLTFSVICGVYYAAPALAQTADTTSAWRYLPLEVGNVWEYGSWVEECFDIYVCETELVGYLRRTIVADSTIAGTDYTVVRDTGISLSGQSGASIEYLVRFDPETARGLRLYPDGMEEVWPGFFPCPLDAPLGSQIDCDNGWEDVFVEIAEEIEVEVEGGSETRPAKYFTSIGGWSAYVADIGLLTSGFAEFGGSWITLSFACTTVATYGTEQFPVAAEPAALEESALAFALFPNPSRDAATVQFTLDAPQRVTLSVFDVLGRRVLATDLGAVPGGEATHRLDVAVLPAGLYVVRLTGDAGARATARIVRN